MRYQTVSTVIENKKRVSRMPGARGMKQLLPALAAVGSACSFVAGPALALELGELTVESKLGQPLRASIAYALQPHEQLHDYCIFLKPGLVDSGLPGLSKAAISVGDNAIRLTGSIPILEPMLGLQLSVGCPYTPNLQREYAMFFDLNTAAEEPSVQENPAVQESAAAAEPMNGIAASSRSKPQTSAATATTPAQPIVAASRYRVQPGDSLSGIVARITDRPPGLWPAVYAVFEANPDAFIAGDINLLKAGSWLEIPDLYQALGGYAATAVAGEPETVNPPAKAPVATTAESYEGPAAQQSSFNSGFAAPTAPQSVAQPENTTASVADTLAPVNESTNANTRTVDEPAGSTPRTGEISREDSRVESGVASGGILPAEDSPFAAATDTGSRDTVAREPTVIIPDTSIPHTAVPVRDRNPQPASQDSSGLESRSWSWLAWLGGAGVAVFLGLLLFGRQVREKFGSTPIGDAPSAAPQRRRADPERRAAAPAEIDFSFDSVGGDVPSMSLDADLGLGTGLRRSSDIDVAQDFGFSARHDFAQEIDLELPPVTDDEAEQHTTDIIPPHRMAVASILESEIPPSDDDDEYDLSMILDATRQPIVDTHLTAKDLKAVPVDVADDDDSADYTLSREVDYKILEQDYQEEFTTTQALNEEMAKAAMELAHTMSGNISSEQTAEMRHDRKTSTPSSDVTAEMPSRRSELEITAELTGNLQAGGDAVNDDLISDLDDTGVNEELTAELPHDEHEITAEMEIEGGRIDTKKSRLGTRKSRRS